jgi:hypothetical protein
MEAGYTLTKGGPNEMKLLCPNPEHNDTNASCNINTAKNLFRCLGCGKQGDVFSWVMMIEKCDFKTACVKLGVENDEQTHCEHSSKPRQPRQPDRQHKPAYKPPPAKDIPEAKSKPKYRPSPEYLTKAQAYKDHKGKVVYKSIRYDYPDGTKEFQLCHVNELGADVFTMKGVQRIPYNYDIFTKVNTIYFVEGEKCADAMMEILRMPATTTVGGSKAWQKEYAEYFSGKHLILIPDNDDAGRAYMKQVADDCMENAASIKILDLFSDKKYEKKWDIADEIQEKDHPDFYANEIAEQALLAPSWIGGVRVDGATAEQLTAKLRKRYRDWQGGGLDLKEIFPAFSSRALRPLVGGDVLVLNAQTGAGKTALAQNIAVHYNEVPIPWFSIELEETRMHERNLILTNEMTGDEVESAILAEQHLDTSRFDHIHIYDNAMCDLDYIDKQLTLMPLKTGSSPRLAVVDYIQLMRSPNGAKNLSPFERISENAVGIKMLAKKHNIVICLISQIGRKDEANLGAAKGSGAIEESATVLIGLNYADGIADAREVGVFKNSNGDSDFREIVSYIGKYFKFMEARPMPRSVTQLPARNPDGSTNERSEDQPF